MGESHWAAEAAECANEQGKFWDYHDVLIQKWVSENAGTYQKANLKKFAADLKLDTTQFNQCLDSDQTASIVQADVTEGSKLGVQGTPSFYANGSPLRLSSLDFASFQQSLDALLR